MKGATPRPVEFFMLFQFQSTHPWRVRRNSASERWNCNAISIHAPVKGATSTWRKSMEFHTYFNPRTREGCDKELKPYSLTNLNFNPRTREGCDAKTDVKYLVCDYISIHAPVKGATGSWWLGFRPTNYFNPRTREGCDLFYSMSLQNLSISIHAPVKGATL